MSSEWAKFKAKMKTRRSKGKQPTGKDHILREESLVVQRLSSCVSGKAQKYTRVGAREFVPFPYTEVTVANIREACGRHFSDAAAGGGICDVLAGEQGPSCSSVSQVPDLKVIYIRFIEDSNDTSQLPSLSRPVKKTAKLSKHTHQLPDITSTCMSLNSHSKHNIPEKSKFVPKSLSAIDMMKLGKVIKNSSKPIKVSEFLIDGMCWSSSKEVEFRVEDEPFGEGGFRIAFKATSNLKPFNLKTWVLKKYNQKTIDQMVEVNQTIEQHSRKQVQMHCLARNIAGKMSEELERMSIVVNKEFGESLHYNNIYLGLIGQDEYVTLEEFIPGTFTKYVNNDGKVCENDCIPIDLREKSECLVHYSYAKADKELAIVDIQGCGYSLCDPEIASRTVFTQDEELLFTTGNLSLSAINNFFDKHTCNKFCKILNLDTISN